LQVLLEVTVIVNVTVFPASPAPAVYEGVVVVALVKEPVPLCVHKMVPRAEVAPDTVVVPKWQMVADPPAVAAGSRSTFTV
jgi:hypothetical protein